MTVYLVYLHYDDGQMYESMEYERLFVAFDSMEKAIDFCKNNSEFYNEEDDEYKILTEREIVDPETGNAEKIKPRMYEDCEYGDYYWLTIRELNIL